MVVASRANPWRGSPHVPTLAERGASGCKRAYGEPSLPSRLVAPPPSLRRRDTPSPGSANDQILGPDSPVAFFERLSRTVPEASDVVTQYVRKSVTAYRSGCYLASSVIIGVASEAAFLKTAQAFGAWLPDDQGSRFLRVVNDDRTGISGRFKEFRTKLHPYVEPVLRGRFEGPDVDLNGVFDLLREHRNDAGHPRGRAVDRDAVFDHHRMLVRYLRKLYDLRAFFEQDRERRRPVGQGSGSSS